MEKGEEMKIGDSVKTEDGNGLITDTFETNHVKRYQVTLDVNPFDFLPWYNKNELELLKDGLSKLN